MAEETFFVPVLFLVRKIFGVSTNLGLALLARVSEQEFVT